jgi:hypothetical protein
MGATDLVRRLLWKFGAKRKCGWGRAGGGVAEEDGRNRISRAWFGGGNLRVAEGPESRWKEGKGGIHVFRTTLSSR